VRRVRFLFVFLYCVWAMLSVQAVAAASASPRPLMPNGIEYSRPLAKGEWSVSYSYRREEGRGLRDGTDRVSPADAGNDEFSEVPTRLDRDVHHFGLQYAPFERLTVALRLPFIVSEMRNRSVDDTPDRYTTKSKGVGDLELMALIPFMQKREEKLDLHAGIRLPTGRIDERDSVPGDDERVLLPRAMQTGSRSVALRAGLTYSGAWNALGWGVHGTGSLGVENNGKGYRRGDSLSFSGWMSHPLIDSLGASVRLGYEYWQRDRGKRVVGEDDHLGSLRSTTGGQRLSISPGLNLALPFVTAQTLKVEASFPVYRDLRGPQVEEDWALSTGWEWTF